MKKIMLLLFMCIFFIGFIGCAEDQQVVKKTPAPVTPPVTVKKEVTPAVKPTAVVNVKEVKDVYHYITFRTEPLGAEIINIDTQTGKEVISFGKTPTRILVLKKKVEVDMYGVNCTNVQTNANGTAYGKTKNEGVEYQFKFRLAGYYDEIKIERISFSSTNDSDLTLNINLTPMKK
jgi:hypothetical protein